MVTDIVIGREREDRGDLVIEHESAGEIPAAGHRGSLLPGVSLCWAQ